MTAEHIEQRIRKLLAIANDPAASDHERDTALKIASRLSAEHAIEMDQLGAEADEFGQQAMGSWALLSEYVFPIFIVLDRFFNVRCTRTSYFDGRTGRRSFDKAVVFGCKASRDVATYVFTFLRREFLKHAAEITRQKNAGRRLNATQQRSIFYSLSAGLCARLAAERTKDCNNDPAFRDGLILVSRHLDDAFHAALPDCASTKPKDHCLYSEAIARGRDISIKPAIRTSQSEAKRIGVTG